MEEAIIKPATNSNSIYTNYHKNKFNQASPNSNNNNTTANTNSTTDMDIQSSSDTSSPQQKLLSESQKKDIKKKPFVERAGDWICYKCKNLNFSFRVVCNRCQMTKKDSDKLEGSNKNSFDSTNEVGGGN
jgi:hypothetical protein